MKTILYLDGNYCRTLAEVSSYVEQGQNNVTLREEILAAHIDGTLYQWLDEGDSDEESHLANELRGVESYGKDGRIIGDSKRYSSILKIFTNESIVISKPCFADIVDLDLAGSYYTVDGDSNSTPLSTPIDMIDMWQEIELHIKIKTKVQINEDYELGIKLSDANLTGKSLISSPSHRLNTSEMSIKTQFVVFKVLKCDIICVPERTNIVDTILANITHPSLELIIDNSSVIKLLPVRLIDTNMVYVEGGTFQMGSNDSDAYYNENPVHSVTLDSYFIGKYSVTQKLWSDIMGSNPSQLNKGNYPVINVSWYDCVEFCNELSKRENLNPCYIINGDDVTMCMSANGYRLPTEAEWEFAARGGVGRRDYQYAIDDVAWYGDNSDGATHSVGLKQANELGIHDIRGNVWEWCWDFDDLYSSSSQMNPTGAAFGSDRVCRGGSYCNLEGLCRSTMRYNHSPSDNVPNLGLRLVRRP